MKRIAHFGAFDHDSYGDLLFPHLAEHFLPDVSVTHVAPTAIPTRWIDARPICGVDEAIGRTDWDGILIGGGDIIQSSDWTAPKWERRLDVPFTALPSLWVGASFLAAKLNIPVAWNAPGVPAAFSGVFSEAVRLALEAGDYLAVRDAKSRDNLAPQAARPIALVPDSALAVGRLWPRDLQASHWTLCCSRRDMLTRPDDIRRATDRVRSRSGQGKDDLLLLSLMPWEFDTDTLHAAVNRARLDVGIYPGPVSLAATARLIGASRGYMGSSLHGLITALSYGVPAVLVLPDHSGASHKYAGFLEAAGIDPSAHLAATWTDAPDKLARQQDRVTVSPAALAGLDHHWERIREVLLAGPRDKSALWKRVTARGHAHGERMTLQGLTPASLCAAYEQRLRALQTGVAERDQWIGQLMLERDAWIARLTAERDVALRRLDAMSRSKSWAVTAPLRRLAHGLRSVAVAFQRAIGAVTDRLGRRGRTPPVA